MKRGINRNIIDMNLAEVSPEEELERAQKLVVKKLKSIKSKDPYERKRKLINYLYSRGFSRDTVYAVVDTKIKLT